MAVSNSTSPFSPPTPPKTPKAYHDICDGATTSSAQPERSADFSRWRPSFHLMAPRGWMNDPCGPGYDPVTGLYHISFQWNQKDNDWGEGIAWGHATSADMLIWDIAEEPCMKSDRHYDGKGVFTGCLLNGPSSELVHFYTSVRYLPIHWTLPYEKGCESLSLAVSKDNGQSWIKSETNPILSRPPPDLDVTGWRDPFISTWASMARLLGRPSSSLFACISGGTRNQGPTTFLYAIDSEDLSRWTYLGPVTLPRLDFKPSRWSGDYGRNWEVTNFATLYEDGDEQSSLDFIIMGAETHDCRAKEDNPKMDQPVTRIRRNQLWMSGPLTTHRNNDGITRCPYMAFSFGGYLDHGCLYAANSFRDPVSGQRIVWGWITEEDLGDELRHQQGWSGLLSLPRQLSLQTLWHVKRAWNSKLEDITSIKVTRDTYGTASVKTLVGIPVLSVVQKLRCNPGVKIFAPSSQGLSSYGARNLDHLHLTRQMRTKQWEVDCSFNLSRSCQQAGLTIGHTADFSSATVLCFNPTTEMFTIHRPSLSLPNSRTLINSEPEIAPHTLFTMRDPNTGEEYTELLRIRAWRDNSVLEVFVNDRTAISTRIYTDKELGEEALRIFAHDGSEDSGIDGEFSTKLTELCIWDGIGVPIARKESCL